MRDNPHEGLDICCYRDQNNRTNHLEHNTKIPAIYDGVVVNILDDFLGKSVVIKHEFSDTNDRYLYTLYGHTDPDKRLQKAKTVKEGDLIATIADTSGLKSNILPHLHISAGWVGGNISKVQLSWDTINNPEVISLIDPAIIIA